jgi:hypothetical protein
MFAFAIVVGSLGCGGSSLAPLKEKAQLLVDRESLGFGQEFGSSTKIGTAPQDSIKLENGGKEDLIISSTVLSGDPAFTINGPTKTTLGARELTFIQVIFTPTAEKLYAGTITIASNAQNGTRTIMLSGRGTKPITDGGP